MRAMRSDVGSERMPTWLRVFLLANVVEDAATGLSGLLFGDRILAPLDVTPLNGRFVGALYVSGGIGILLAALARTTRDVRAILASFLTIVVLVECVTFVYWSEFTNGRTPVVWLVTYTVDPIVLVLVLVSISRVRTQGASTDIDPGPVGAILRAQAFVFGVVGVALLIGTEGIRELWPWTLPALVARVYASFFLALAVGAAIAARRVTAVTARTILAPALAIPVLGILASLAHLSRLESGLPTAAWFGANAAVSVLALAGLVLVEHARAQTPPAGRRWPRRRHSR